jgi:putative endopeptidase
MRSAYFIAPLAVLLTAGTLLAEPAPVKFTVSNMDPKVDPATDFYRFANGHWLKSHEIPADHATWGLSDELIEINRARLREILEKCAETRADRTPVEQQVGDFYASAIDTQQVEKLKFDAIRPLLEKVSALTSKDELPALLAELHERGYGGLFDASVSPDAKQSTVYALEFDQGGLGLPDRDYYFEPQFKKEREAYNTHLGKMQTLLGADKGEIPALVKSVVTIETALAKASRKTEDLQDPLENYHKLPLAELEKLAPAFGWRKYLAAAGVATPLETVIVGQPEFFEALSRLLTEAPLDDWKAYLRAHVLAGAAPMLHAAAEQEDFAFHGTVLNGQPQMDARWKRATRRVDRAIGEALGQLYMQRYFPAEARTRMGELVKNLEDVYHDRLTKVPWMSEATRQQAVAKFARFGAKIGGPEKPRDYAKLEIKRDDYLGNVERAAAFESRREVARIGQPVDRTEWEMTAPTVNAYFAPTKNEIVFPAGILQPPFFDVDADDAVNYGGTAATIGHEMTHGFDSEGRKFDAEGNLRDWWTADDAKEYEARAHKLVEQFNGFEALPGLHVNGKLTLTENIADLGGLSIAFEALERTLAKDPSKRQSIDGYTPEQRFFIAYAQSWVGKEREEYRRRMLSSDPHAPEKFRAYAPLQNLEEFFDAFGIKPGAKMWLPPEKRSVIW